MKKIILCMMIFPVLFVACDTKKETEADAPEVPLKTEKKLFLDVHALGAGKVTLADVAEAHKKDLATQSKYDVSFIKYWVDEKAGKVYCLAEAPDGYLVHKTHKEAHGLVPDDLMQVTDGPEVSLTGKQLFLDIHELGAGNVTAEAVAEAHEKDLAAQEKHGVSFINYWVDTNAGTVVCLSEAADSASVVATHKEAHGLIPVSVQKVSQGN
jgi:hypothetical protein